MIPVFCGRSLVVKHQLPKLRLRVRFSSPAPNFRKQSDLFGLFSFYKRRKTAIVSTPNDSGLFSIPNMLVYSLVFDDSIFLSFQSPYSAICISAPKDSMIFLSIFSTSGQILHPCGQAAFLNFWNRCCCFIKQNFFEIVYLLKICTD